jgi:hypothetical protein
MLLRNNIKKSVREMRQEEEKRLGGEGEAWAHWRQRNRAKEPADVAEFGERFCDVLAMDSRGGKGDERGCHGYLKAALAWRKS